MDRTDRALPASSLSPLYLRKPQEAVAVVVAVAVALAVAVVVAVVVAVAGVITVGHAGPR